MKTPEACHQPPSPTLRAAIRQFNDGAYFACHETLEELWRIQDDPLRDFYQGLLQIAVGLLHRQKGNFKGARSLIVKGSTLIRPMAPDCLAIDVNKLLGQCELILVRLEESTAPAPKIHLLET